jgi:hypothetical protein
MDVYYYGTQYSLESIGKDFGTNMLVIGVMDFIADVTTGTSWLKVGFFVEKVKRKKAVLILTLLIGLSGCLFIFSFVKNSLLAQMIIVAFGRFLMSTIVN